MLPRGCCPAECASLNATSSPSFSSLYVDTILTAHQLQRTVPSTILESSRIMRLLQFNDDGDVSLTEFFEDDIPEYAILSHRWGAEEVTYNDLLKGTGKSKAGYRKIRFCGEQARRDGLQYFWVDTCCTIQTHHRRQRPTKRVAYAAENGGRTYIAFQYKRMHKLAQSQR